MRALLALVAIGVLVGCQAADGGRQAPAVAAGFVPAPRPAWSLAEYTRKP